MTADPRSTLPWQLVAGLGVPFGCERSFRLGPGSLLADRFLLTISLGSLGARGPAAVRDLCAALAMPDHLRAPMERALGRARFLHVGSEAGPGTKVYKVYLELGQRPIGTDSIVLHEAFKWDAARPVPGVVARYVFYPESSFDGIHGRLAALYGDSQESLDIANSVVDLAENWTQSEHVRYLEVTEEGNPRRSFDLNLYDVGLKVGDLGPQLTRLRKRYEIPPDRFAEVFDRVCDQRLGHVAGGVHRAGEDFFTVYYGVEEGQAYR